MKRRSLLLSLLALAIATPANGAWPAQLSLCAIMEGPIANGQAVVVGANDTSLLCVTASHLAPTVGQTLNVRWTGGRTETGQVIKVDANKHLSAFTLPNRGERLPFILGDTPKDQRQIVAARVELTGKITGFKGQFTSAEGSGFWMTGRNEPGDSGGAVFDTSRNQLVGVQVGRRDNGTDGTLAVSGQAIREFTGEFVGGLVSLDGVELTQQCNRFSQRLAPNRFNFASNRINVNNNNINNLELAFQLDTLLAQVQRQDDTINSLQQQIVNVQGGAVGQPGPAGPAGANGQDGANGQPGADATVDYTKIWDWIRDNVTIPSPAGTQPLTLNFLDGDGKVSRSEPVKDGQINIPPTKAWWLRLDGKTEKQARVLGEPLKFQDELLRQDTK